jgi:hypothetical protein
MVIDVPWPGITTVSCRARYGNEVSAWCPDYIVDQYGVIEPWGEEIDELEPDEEIEEIEEREEKEETEP